MKLKLIIVLLSCATFAGYAQETKVDSTEKKPKFSIKIGGRDTVKLDTLKPVSKFSIQFTFSRIDFGLAKLLDNGSFTLSPGNQDLESSTWKSTNFGFEFFQMGYRFSNYFKIYMGGGVDWMHLRLKKDITVQPEKDVFTTVPETTDFKKNRFSSTYLRVPLSFQFRTRNDHKGNKVYFVAGPEVGFLINGKTKQVSDGRKKEKVKDDFNLNPFRYGGSVRLGYDDLGVYVKYYSSNFFADNQGPSDLSSLNFGIMLGF